MASPVFTAFLHSAYLNSGKDWNKTVVTLETVLAGNFSSVQDGGRVLISSTINGKSFAFTLPPGVTAQTINSMAHRAWALVSNSLVTDPTGALLNTFLLAPATSTTVADFTFLNP